MSKITDDELRQKYNVILIGDEERKLLDWFHIHIGSPTDDSGYTTSHIAEWRKNTVDRDFIALIKRELSLHMTRVKNENRP